MKRYKTMSVPGACTMVESSYGQWVKLDDVRSCFGVGFECNCEKMYEAPSYEYGMNSDGVSWICPAHGYKKK